MSVRSLTKLILLCALAAPALAQQAAGTITGRVIADDGQPIRHGMIAIRSLGGGPFSLAGRAQIVTDEEGNFTIDRLDPAPYVLQASAPAYVDPAFDSEPRYVRVGEAVTLTLIRGGVITGRVTNAAGAPVVGMQIRAQRVRDEAGRPNQTLSNGRPGSATTDDRGVYRIYGLAPGAYVVSTGSGVSASLRPSPFAGRTATYHPSSTRDTAAEVRVARGGEATGIDIRYRGEAGAAISGRVSGAPAKVESGIQFQATAVMLRNPATGALLETTYLYPGRNSNELNGYAFYGLPNGEYELLAAWLSDETNLLSPPRRVILKGGNLTGIDLAMTPLASLAGTVAIETPAPDAPKCEGRRPGAIEEIVLRARRDEPEEKGAPVLTLLRNGHPESVPDENGAFRFRALQPGRARFEISLPDERWYVKSLAMPPASLANGLLLKAGERATGLRVTIGWGAAAVQGKIVAPADGRLPARLRVHLLPTEPEAKDDPLRFFETQAGADGVFSFSHLAPGKYLLLARPAPEAEFVRPAARDAQERARLRQEAAAGALALDLTACQRVQSEVPYRVR